MSHKKNQEKAELSIYQQSLKVARAKGEQARRNVARLSGDIRSFDRPDILITAEGGNRISGRKHVRVNGPLRVVQQRDKRSRRSAQSGAEGKPFAATTSVQLAYDIAKDSLKHKNGNVEPQDVLKAIGRMDPSEKNARMENWRKQWLIDNV